MPVELVVGGSVIIVGMSVVAVVLGRRKRKREEEAFRREMHERHRQGRNNDEVFRQAADETLHQHARWQHAQEGMEHNLNHPKGIRVDVPAPLRATPPHHNRPRPCAMHRGVVNDYDEHLEDIHEELLDEINELVTDEGYVGREPEPPVVNDIAPAYDEPVQVGGGYDTDTDGGGWDD